MCSDIGSTLWPKSFSLTGFSTEERPIFFKTYLTFTVFSIINIGDGIVYRVNVDVIINVQFWSKVESSLSE